MSSIDSKTSISGAMVATIIGIIGGVLLVTLTQYDLGFGGSRIDRSGRLAILINGVPERMARDVLLPTYGWILQVQLPDADSAESIVHAGSAESVEALAGPPDGAPEGLVITLRSERTGATIEIQDRFKYVDDFATLTIPKALGLAAGLLSVQATLVDASGNQFEDLRRLRIRSSLGGLPIGSRQVIQFDFGVDRDADGTADFQQDLERFGLATSKRPDLAAEVASRIEARGLARVEAAYDSDVDPNRTGGSRDQVIVWFRATTDPGALITRICVGGSDPTGSAVVGHVRFDRQNEAKFSMECPGDDADDAVAGIFPTELETYRDSKLYREVLDPFIISRGGTPIGEHPEDAAIVLGKINDASLYRGTSTARKSAIDRAVVVMGDVLGSIMAHEAGHALGLVAEGKPAAGLFGGGEGDAYVHNIDAFGEREPTPWLMNQGRSFTFEDLAGESETGPLRFRPLNYAYLRDRVVLTD